MVSFTAMGVGGRELADTMNAFEVSFVRACGSLLIVLAVLPRFGLAYIRPRRIGLHLLRNCFQFMAQTLWFFSLGLLPLATVFALEFTFPIWSAVLAAVLLGERMKRGRVAAFGMGFLGVLVIVRPGAEVFDPNSIIVLVAAIGFAVSVVGTKPLATYNTPLAIIFVMNVVHIPLGLATAVWAGWVWPTWNDLPWIAAVGISGLTAHFCMTRAFMLADASLVLPIDYLRLPAAAGLGYLLYDERVEFALAIGAVIILAGNLYSIRYERKLRSRVETAKGGAHPE